jgi:hypothetical protein
LVRVQSRLPIFQAVAFSDFVRERAGYPFGYPFLLKASPRTYNAAMGKVEKIERDIKSLSPEEMSELREWFAAFDAEAWDRQFEADVHAGKLDALGEKALKAHAARKTTKF